MAEIDITTNSTSNHMFPVKSSIWEIDGYIAYLRLRNGVAVVGVSDLPLLEDFEWYVGNRNYLVRTDATGALFAHRIIMSPRDKEIVDHIDGNGLNNKRSNLRICTHAENMRNRKIASHNKSGYKGVYKDNKKNRWRAEICFNKKRYRLGSFGSAISAALAYDKAAISLHGEFARTNF